MGIYLYDTLPSTMDEARAKALEGAEDGAVIVAREQSKGRGRRGRLWESLPGNLLMTYITYRDIPLSKAPLLSFVACVAVGEAIRPMLPPGNSLRYKWPNDVFLNQKKVSGLLLEALAVPGITEIAYLIGCGLNLTTYPQTARYPATSFQNEGIYFSLNEVLQKIIPSLKHYVDVFQEQGFDPIRTLWMQGAGNLEGKIALEFQGKIQEGIFKGIDEEGALLLDSTAGLLKLTVGEIHKER
jgi:BirA family transcriptional regulator, biotin operon repressor / biotin---[acetyl-CoA-carboxylase] ligase